MSDRPFLSLFSSANLLVFVLCTFFCRRKIQLNNFLINFFRIFISSFAGKRWTMNDNISADRRDCGILSDFHWWQRSIVGLFNILFYYRNWCIYFYFYLEHFYVQIKRYSVLWAFKRQERRRTTKGDSFSFSNWKCSWHSFSIKNRIYFN